ncbi:AlbA family DNA-binding domain-containing protein [Desulfonatronum lacustre]|uniref:AlbA family DNA-binding domain-containing protein n=1 Tax=Desulfonatronum lacustre TaxID=66849 RepID=UPI00048E2EFE|nr:ATP-binding protein [Desulfonatronum lacustre]
MNLTQYAQLFEKLRNEPSEKYESDILEFKHYASESALHNAKDLAEEISALANHLGGIILIGVKDSSNITHGRWQDQLAGFCPIDIHTTRERLRGKLKPAVDIEIAMVPYDGKNYLVIQIPRRRDTLVATTSGKVCIRDGKSSRPMTPDEIKLAVKNLQDYDWSAEYIDGDPSELLNESAVLEALTDFLTRRKIDGINRASFLEAIGATCNGILTKSGLLFLGKATAIRKHLGKYEYRYSRKTTSGCLHINDVWEDCLWETIKRVRHTLTSVTNSN